MSTVMPKPAMIFQGRPTFDTPREGPQHVSADWLELLSAVLDKNTMLHIKCNAPTGDDVCHLELLSAFERKEPKHASAIFCCPYTRA